MRGVSWLFAALALPAALVSVVLADELSAPAPPLPPEATDESVSLAGGSFRPAGFICARCGRRGGWCSCQCPCPAGPSATPPSPLAPIPAPGGGESAAQPGGNQPLAPSTADSMASAFGAAAGPSTVGANMIGDFFMGGAFSGHLDFVGHPAAGNYYGGVPYTNYRLAAPIASHTIKMGADESPWPRTRVYFVNNYYNHVGDSTGITSQLLGFERALPSGRASVGFRLPFYEVAPGSFSNPAFTSGSVGTFGAGTGSLGNIGDLTTIFKYALLYDPQGGNVLTAGAMFVAPTGPATIGGVAPLYTVNGVSHSGSAQPFLAFYRSLRAAGEGLFVQGFASFDSPFDSHDATYNYNDLGIGYFLQTGRCRGLTAIVPTVEVHTNVPLNNVTHGVTATPLLAQLTGGAFTGFTGPGGTIATVQYSSQVNITSGVTAIFNQRHSLTSAIVVPTNGPNPFAFECFAMWNTYIGPLTSRALYPR